MTSLEVAWSLLYNHGLFFFFFTSNYSFQTDGVKELHCLSDSWDYSEARNQVFWRLWLTAVWIMSVYSLVSWLCKFSPQSQAQSQKRMDYVPSKYMGVFCPRHTIDQAKISRHTSSIPLQNSVLNMSNSVWLFCTFLFSLYWFYGVMW